MFAPYLLNRLTGFVKLYSNVLLSETVYRAHEAATLTLGHWSRSRDLSLDLVSVPSGFIRVREIKKISSSGNCQGNLCCQGKMNFA